jgi:hypothetical protein
MRPTREGANHGKARPHRLLTHLTLFAVGIGFPPLLLALVAGWISVAHQQARIDREAERLVSDNAGNLERDFAALIAAAQTLATADTFLRDHDFAGFYQAAKSVPWCPHTPVRGLVQP